MGTQSTTAEFHLDGRPEDSGLPVDCLLEFMYAAGELVACVLKREKFRAEFNLNKTVRYARTTSRLDLAVPEVLPSDTTGHEALEPEVSPKASEVSNPPEAEVPEPM